ncbi:hypothetical protein IF1G_03334 [Cordyceps javanica]|uniref:Uncharacterized protein n=1 Tax=Cordyceps javanica TaxID=43265 RepID=A0A545V7A3_9HYPO|nr:hypothetical protein IF1G_03334 [Cordyceps javanica]
MTPQLHRRPLATEVESHTPLPPRGPMRNQDDKRQRDLPEANHYCQKRKPFLGSRTLGLSSALGKDCRVCITRRLISILLRFVFRTVARIR